MKLFYINFLDTYLHDSYMHFFLVEATKSEVQSQYTKPKMSYAQLIAEALLTGSERMLTLNDIYIAINKQHPYYSLDAASGRNWQNAIRLVKLVGNILSGFHQRLPITLLEELIRDWRYSRFSHCLGMSYYVNLGSNEFHVQ